MKELSTPSSLPKNLSRPLKNHSHGLKVVPNGLKVVPSSRKVHKSLLQAFKRHPGTHSKTNGKNKNKKIEDRRIWPLRIHKVVEVIDEIASQVIS